MKTNQILLADTSKTPIRKEWYLQTKYHPKCIQVVHDKMLVSSQDASGEWYLNLMTVEGAVCRSIKYKRLLDGYILAIQSIPTETNNFRIIHYCKVANNLQCFGSDGSFVFDYGVDSVVAVVTDPNGYIYAIRRTGEIQILSPNGHFILRLYTGALSKGFKAAFNKTKDMLIITKYKEPKIDVLSVERTRKVEF